MPRPMSVNVKIDDGAIGRKLKAMGTAAERVLSAAVMAGAKVILGAANPLAPDPILLAEVTERSPRRAVAEVGPPDQKWYWMFYETGAVAHEITGHPLAFMIDDGDLITTGRVLHPGMAAQPFLRPAWDSQHQNAATRAGNEFKGVIE